MPVTTSESYGSNEYQYEVLKDRPIAYFVSYDSSTQTIIDSSSRQLLSASLAPTASYTKQIPFFALSNDNCTFNINSSNKISIYENGTLFPSSIGVGKFSLGDENSNFAVEFTFSKNFDTGSNNDFARFGIYNSFYTAGVSYDNIGNAIYLSIYSSDGKLRFRSVVYGGMSALSKHVVINFVRGKPSFYVNGTKGINCLDELSEIVFFQPKTLNRLVAEFSCETDNENISISNIAFYNHELTYESIVTHYNALYDIGDYDSYALKHGSVLLNKNINHDSVVAQNDEYNQSFIFSNIHGLTTDPYIRPLYYPNFYPVGETAEFLDVDYSSGSAGVSPSVNFRITSDDIQQTLLENGVSVSFKGIGSGAYTEETPLVSISNSNVGDFYISIDAASSTVFLGTGSSTLLSSISSSFAKNTLYTVVIKFDDDTIIYSIDDLSNSIYASYTFASAIDLTSSKIDFFNRYYYDSSSQEYVYIGNGEIDLASSYIGSDEDYKFFMSNTIKNRRGNDSWDYKHYKKSQANVLLPIPSKNYGYIKIDDTSDNINYTLYNDNSETALKNDYIVNIPSTSSYANVLMDIDGYWSGRSLNPKNPIYVRDIKIYSYPAASFSSGEYSALLEAPDGIINNVDSHLNISRRSNIGFMCVPNGLIRISQENSLNDEIGLIEFLISIPNEIENITQYLIYSNAASMTLVPNSGSYSLNFTGLSASINSISATSSTTKLLPRHLYFVQASFTTPVTNGSYVYMFSDSAASSYFRHSFDYLSVFPYTEDAKGSRYAQLFGRRNYSISDDDGNYFKLQGGGTSSDVYTVNTTWQSYTS